MVGYGVVTPHFLHQVVTRRSYLNLCKLRLARQHVLKSLFIQR